jgi:hypothetical protein
VLGPLELSLTIIIALLVGPLTWDHYASWTLIPIVCMAESALWVDRTVATRWLLALGLGVSFGLLSMQTFYFGPEAIRDQYWLRAFTGTKTIALCLLLAVGARLLSPGAPTSRSHDGPSDGRSGYPTGRA